MKTTLTKAAASSTLAGLGALIMASSVFVLSAPTATAAGTDKVFVCKFITTPGDGEILQTGTNPISVSVSAIMGADQDTDAANLVGKSFFNDKQERSLVIAVDNTAPGPEGDPGVSACGTPEVPTEPVIVTGTPTLTDECGPGNEVLSTPPANVMFTPIDNGTSIQVTVSAVGDGFVLDQAQTVFNFTVNDAACPPKVVTAAAPTFTDKCGAGNEVLTLPVTEGVTYSQATAGDVITVTATANAGFALSAPATFNFTVNNAVNCDQVLAEDGEVLGEQANNNNNNNNGSPEVLGAQASANNAPAPAVQQSAPAQVPTVINAGIAGEAPANPLAPAAVALFGALMGLIALGMRGGLARLGGGKA